jgi:hypothetical protein
MTLIILNGAFLLLLFLPASIERYIDGDNEYRKEPRSSNNDESLKPERKRQRSSEPKLKISVEAKWSTRLSISYFLAYL